jgi:hypothetical protein
MEPTDTPTIPLAEPPQVEQTDGASGMMARFQQMKAAEPASEQPANTEPPATQEPADDTPEPETTPAPTQQQPKPEKAKWGELKQKAQERDELVNTKLPSLEKELAELKEKAAKLEQVDPTRYEKQIQEKEKAIQDYERKLAVFDVRESQQFKTEVIAPMSRVGADMDRLAATYKISAQDLKDALTIPDPAAQMAKITELTQDMTDIHKHKVWAAVDQTQEIYSKAAEIEANAVEAKKEMEFLQSQETEKQKQESQKRLSTAAEAVRKQMAEHLPLLKDEAIAKDVFAANLNETDPTMIAYNAMAGKALVHAVKENRTLATKVASLEAELAKRSSLAPKGGGGGQQQPPAAQPTQPEGDSLFSRYKNWKQSA